MAFAVGGGIAVSAPDLESARAAIKAVKEAGGDDPPMDMPRELHIVSRGAAVAIGGGRAIRIGPPPREVHVTVSAKRVRSSSSSAEDEPPQKKARSDSGEEVVVRGLGFSEFLRGWQECAVRTDPFDWARIKGMIIPDVLARFWTDVPTVLPGDVVAAAGRPLSSSEQKIACARVALGFMLGAFAQTDHMGTPAPNMCAAAAIADAMELALVPDEDNDQGYGPAAQISMLGETDAELDRTLRNAFYDYSFTDQQILALFPKNGIPYAEPGSPPDEHVVRIVREWSVRDEEVNAVPNPSLADMRFLIGKLNIRSNENTVHDLAFGISIHHVLAFGEVYMLDCDVHPGARTRPTEWCALAFAIAATRRRMDVAAVLQAYDPKAGFPDGDPPPMFAFSCGLECYDAPLLAEARALVYLDDDDVRAMYTFKDEETEKALRVPTPKERAQIRKDMGDAANAFLIQTRIPVKERTEIRERARALAFGIAREWIAHGGAEPE